MTSVTATACWRLSSGEDGCQALSGLAPGATFSYQVPVSGDRWVSRALPDRGPLRVAAFGDSGQDRAAQWEVGRLVNRLDPHLVLLLGDIVYPAGADSHYDQKYFRPYAKVLPRIPFFPSIGNHDYGNDDDPEDGDERFREAYRRIHRRPRYYSFDAGPAHFVSIDVNEAYDIGAAAPITEGSQQWRWLDRDLGASEAPWKIAFLHVPVYSSYRHGDHELLQRALEPLFVKHGVRLVLQGHNHLYERTKPIKGVVYVTAGTGGAKLKRREHEPPEWLEVMRLRHGLALLMISDKRMALEFIADDGGVLDRASWSR